MAKKPKFYVVWKGRETGVFSSWDDCKAQTNGFDGAVFKSFESKEQAEEGKTILFVGTKKQAQECVKEAAERLLVTP